MSALKLPKLPDRTPVKLAISVAPELKRALDDYARVYENVHGSAEPLAELIPAMLAAFLEDDRGFRKARGALNEFRPEA